MKRLICVLVVCGLIAGCTPIERNAYNTAVAAKAFLDSIKAKHPECPGPSTLCVDLVKATAAKDLLISAGEAYCHVDQFASSDTTPCTPAPKGTPSLTQTLSALQSAIAGYNVAANNLKAVIQ